MKRILVTPYPGMVYFTRDFQALRRLHKRLTGDYPVTTDATGLTVHLEKPGFAPAWLVYGKSVTTISHEMNHVALHVFANIGTDPRSGRGEPFCYLQAHLVEQALKR